MSFPRGSLLSLGVQHGVAPGIDVYVVAVASYALMQQRDFKRNPDKARRYQVLPLQYKLAYGLVVLPMIVAVPLILLFVFRLAVFGSGVARSGFSGVRWIGDRVRLCVSEAWLVELSPHKRIESARVACPTRKATRFCSRLATNRRLVQHVA